VERGIKHDWVSNDYNHDRYSLRAIARNTSVFVNFLPPHCYCLSTFNLTAHTVSGIVPDVVGVSDADSCTAANSNLTASVWLA
jgi:hypothetical protein